MRQVHMLPLFQQEMKWELLHTARILTISLTFLEVACARMPIAGRRASGAARSFLSTLGGGAAFGYAVLDVPGSFGVSSTGLTSLSHKTLSHLAPPKVPSTTRGLFGDDLLWQHTLVNRAAKGLLVDGPRPLLGSGHVKPKELPKALLASSSAAPVASSQDPTLIPSLPATGRPKAPVLEEPESVA